MDHNPSLLRPLTSRVSDHVVVPLGERREPSGSGHQAFHQHLPKPTALNFNSSVPSICQKIEQPEGKATRNGQATEADNSANARGDSGCSGPSGGKSSSDHRVVEGQCSSAAPGTAPEASQSASSDTHSSRGETLVTITLPLDSIKRIASAVYLQVIDASRRKDLRHKRAWLEVYDRLHEHLPSALSVRK